MTPQILREWFPGTTAPFICDAPMMGFASAKVAIAMTKAGGFGLIGGGFDFTPSSTQGKDLAAELAKTRMALSLSSSDVLPVGFGLITAQPNVLNFVEGVLPIVKEYRVAAVWLFAPPERKIHADIIPALKEAGLEWGLKVFVQVGSVQAAREAAEDGADILVVQGVDAGGHQWAQGASLITLLPEVVDMLAQEFKNSKVQIIGAGGVMDGRGIAAALVLGASGVVMGTRILATEECNTTDDVKSAVVLAQDGGQITVKTTFFDRVLGIGHIWPKTYDGRAIVGDTYKDHVSGLSEEENAAKLKAAAAAGDVSRKVIWAGSGVGLAKAIVPISELIKASQEQAKVILQAGQRW